MKGKKFKFTVSLVLTLALFVWFTGAVNAKPLDDEAFLKLCRTGTARQVEDAIKNGADADARDPDGSTALMTAAEHNNNPEVITALVKNGADVSARDPLGRTALAAAALHNNNPDVITALVKSGADVNARDSLGWTALMMAVHNNNPEAIIAALVRNGADVDAKDSDGRTALMWAANHNDDVPQTIAAILKTGDSYKIKQSATIKGNAVRIRSAPDTSDADNVLYRADDGLIVAVIDNRQANPNELWYFIEYQPGERGWVRSDLLTLSYGTPAPAVHSSLQEAGPQEIKSASIDPAAIVGKYPIAPGEVNVRRIRHINAQRLINSQRRADWRRAYDAYVELAGSYSGDYLAAYQAGEAARKLGNINNARTWYDKALEINPNFQPATDAKAGLK